MRFQYQWQTIQSRSLGYGFAVACVAIALGLALLLNVARYVGVAAGLFDIAIIVTAWYAGAGPSTVAVILSAIFFNYFFTEPLYTLEVTREDLPYFLFFTASAIIAAWFVTVRRRIEADLRHARDSLELEVEQRKRHEEEIRALNEQLAKRAQELLASNKELESFAYTVSHDLRAPLRHVVGFSELLQKHASSSLDAKSLRYMQTILEAAKKMGNLIDDLLAFSRIGRAETRMTQVNLDQLVKEVVAEFGQETRGQEIAWKIDSLGVCYGDRSMLRLALVNLVSNAVKFTRMRKPADIEIGRAGGNEAEIEVFVKDNGAGFDMRYVDKLFGVFQRLHLSEQFEGTGIGLATVQRIIHRHGGRVRAEGAVDRGATFYFSLPKAQNAAERMATIP